MLCYKNVLVVLFLCPPINHSPPRLKHTLKQDDVSLAEGRCFKNTNAEYFQLQSSLHVRRLALGLAASTIFVVEFIPILNTPLLKWLVLVHLALVSSRACAHIVSLWECQIKCVVEEQQLRIGGWGLLGKSSSYPQTQGKSIDDFSKWPGIDR